ncbi:MAG: hypothetical protein GF317_11585 [Candidatus Lokiarchaeota archaeon]|nr:hypothetical protein [Candidatus Lokiarchaeota archaeon]MBD3200293.1 hypothetical protein [Candidatus Lokiarchaeota archaeon]
MAILEIGLNLEKKHILNIQYDNFKSTKDWDPSLRAGFISFLDSFSKNVYGKNLDMIKMKDFQMIFHSKIIESFTEPKEQKPLICYCITDNSKNKNIQKDILKEILEQFLNRYAIFDIFTKDEKYFVEFKPRVKSLVENSS